MFEICACTQSRECGICRGAGVVSRLPRPKPAEPPPKDGPEVDWSEKFTTVGPEIRTVRMDWSRVLGERPRLFWTGEGPAPSRYVPAVEWMRTRILQRPARWRLATLLDADALTVSERRGRLARLLEWFAGRAP